MRKRTRRGVLAAGGAGLASLGWLLAGPGTASVPVPREALTTTRLSGVDADGGFGRVAEPDGVTRRTTPSSRLALLTDPPAALPVTNNENARAFVSDTDFGTSAVAVVGYLGGCAAHVLRLGGARLRSDGIALAVTVYDQNGDTSGLVPEPEWLLVRVPRVGVVPPEATLHLSWTPPQRPPVTLTTAGFDDRPRLDPPAPLVVENHTTSGAADVRIAADGGLVNAVGGARARRLRWSPTAFTRTGEYRLTSAETGAPVGTVAIDDQREGVRVVRDGAGWRADVEPVGALPLVGPGPETTAASQPDGADDTGGDLDDPVDVILENESRTDRTVRVAVWRTRSQYGVPTLGLVDRRLQAGATSTARIADVVAQTGSYWVTVAVLDDPDPVPPARRAGPWTVTSRFDDYHARIGFGPTVE